MSSQTFVARITAGALPWAQGELRELGAKRIQPISPRTLSFTFHRKPALLLGLRSIDDILVCLSRSKPLGKSRQALTQFSLNWQPNDWHQAIHTCARVRPLLLPMHVSCSCTLVGDRNYNRSMIESIFLQHLRTHYPHYPVADTAQSTLHFRILLEATHTFIGIRLGMVPLYKRAYQVAHLSGGLKAPIAYGLSKEAEIQADHTVIDPMCGSGTLLFEGGHKFRAKFWEGADIRPEALAICQQRALELPFTPIWTLQDSLHKIWKQRGYDRIICNPPWGKQVPQAFQDKGPGFIQALLWTFSSYLNRGGKMVLLLPAGLTEKDLEIRSLEVEDSLMFRVNGHLCKMWKWRKRHT